MNTKNLAVVGLIVIIGGALYFSQSQSSKAPAMEQANDVMEKKEIAMEPTGAMMKQGSRYVPYTSAAFEEAKGKKRVYFFHASWCPTCKAANTEFLTNVDAIPEDVVLFKTDYDKETALKKQFAITYQHTFVLVDETGKQLALWNGGGINELVENTK